MGLCGKCIYYTKRGVSIFDNLRNDIANSSHTNNVGYCMLMSDDFGSNKRVREFDSCNFFEHKQITVTSNWSSRQ